MSILAKYAHLLHPDANPAPRNSGTADSTESTAALTSQVQGRAKRVQFPFHAHEPRSIPPESDKEEEPEPLMLTDQVSAVQSEGTWILQWFMSDDEDGEEDGDEEDAEAAEEAAEETAEDEEDAEGDEDPQASASASQSKKQAARSMGAAPVRSRSRYWHDYDYEDPFIDDDDDYFAENLVYRPEQTGYFAWRGAVPAVLVEEEESEEEESAEGGGSEMEEAMEEDMKPTEEQPSVVPDEDEPSTLSRENTVVVTEDLSSRALTDEATAALVGGQSIVNEPMGLPQEVVETAPSSKQRKRKNKTASTTAPSVVTEPKGVKSQSRPSTPMDVDAEPSQSKKLKLASPVSSLMTSATGSTVKERTQSVSTDISVHVSNVSPASSAPGTPARPLAPSLSLGGPPPPAPLLRKPLPPSKELSKGIKELLDAFLAAIADKWSFPSANTPVDTTDDGGTAADSTTASTSQPSKQTQIKHRIKQLDSIRKEIEELMEKAMAAFGSWVQLHGSREGKLFWNMLRDSLGLPLPALKKTIDSWVLAKQMRILELQVFEQAFVLRDFIELGVAKSQENWAKKMAKYQQDIETAQNPSSATTTDANEPDQAADGDNENEPSVSTQSAQKTKQPKKPRRPLRKYQWLPDIRFILDRLLTKECILLGMRFRWKSFGKLAIIPRGSALFEGKADDEVIDGFATSVGQLKEIMLRYSLFADDPSISIYADGKVLPYERIYQKVQEFLAVKINDWLEQSAKSSECPEEPWTVTSSDVSRQWALIKRQPTHDLETLFAEKPVFGFQAELPPPAPPLSKSSSVPSSVPAPVEAAPANS